MNELDKEKSPYLKQHAHNPVHWKAWGKSAFDLAQSENKPIFLSIGYSTCHWCHVMEKESFENQEIADFLNDHFVSIKIDREELPEVDSQYMQAVQIMTRRGGWPMSVFLDLKLRPFYGGTYFAPKHFLALLQKITELWKTNLSEIQRASQDLEKILQAKHSKSSRPPFEKIKTKFFELFQTQVDATLGGHEGAPKFPMNYELLCAHRIATTDVEKALALKTSQLTLEKMLSGGIWDHVGGGIHRYSTDEQWRVPHFEKMLYDQASLLSILAENLALQDSDFFKMRAESLIEYLHRDLKIPGGAFYSAEDADSEGHEGTFYIWDFLELKKALTAEEFSNISQHFEISESGNWEGKIVFHSSKTDPSSFKGIWSKLLALRSLRPRPLRDEKVICSWNGLMISALSRYARVCASPLALQMAEEAADFIFKNCYLNKKLYRRWIEGEAKFEAQLEDYAFFIEGLIELSQSSGDKKYLEWAIELQETADAIFYRSSENYYVSNTQEHLLIENEDYSDNVTPSAVSTQILNLIWLGELSTKTEYLDRAEKLLEQVTDALDRYPLGYSRLLEALGLTQTERESVAVVCSPTYSILDRLLEHQKIEKMYKPFRKTIISHDNTHPLLKGKVLKHEKLSFYVCRGKTCKEAQDHYEN